jgi:hypothetical protein
MEEKRPSGVWVVVAVPLFVLAGYVGAYFMRCEVHDYSGFVGPHIIRYYPTTWEATLFRPAARVESLVTGGRVSIGQPVKPPRNSTVP